MNEDYRLLKEFNELTGVPVFAQFVNGSTLFAHYGKPISAFLKEILRLDTRTIKWRNGAIFLTSEMRVMKPTPADALIP